jgi:cobalt/nickel transport system permease protein
MVGMLFIRSFERADRVYHAMASRGYDGSIRTLSELSMQKTDMLKAALLIVIGLSINLCCLIEF